MCGWGCLTCFRRNFLSPRFYSTQKEIIFLFLQSIFWIHLKQDNCFREWEPIFIWERGVERDLLKLTGLGDVRSSSTDTDIQSRTPDFTQLSGKREACRHKHTHSTVSFHVDKQTYIGIPYHRMGNRIILISSHHWYCMYLHINGNNNKNTPDRCIYFFPPYLLSELRYLIHIDR